MKDWAKGYYQQLQDGIGGVEVTTSAGETMSLFDGIEAGVKLFREVSDAKRRIMFIGNGASAAISSHMASDYTKAAGLRAYCFNDGALLTCMGNDFGYEHVFEKPIEMLADPGDLLVCISSSGRSPNILKGVEAARANNLKVMTLSGFKTDNPLRALGDLNFYVPIEGYGPVEVLHHSICHCMLDLICTQNQER